MRPKHRNKLKTTLYSFKIRLLFSSVFVVVVVVFPRHKCLRLDDVFRRRWGSIAMTMIVMVVFGRCCDGAVDGDVDFNGMVMVLTKMLLFVVVKCGAECDDDCR